MSTNKKIDREVDKTLQALDDMERASTDVFFYSRVAAKLESRYKTADKHESSSNLGFAFSVAAVIVILFLNLASISLYQQAFMEEQTDREMLTEELAYDYQLFDLNYYETFEEE